MHHMTADLSSWCERAPSGDNHKGRGLRRGRDLLAMLRLLAARECTAWMLLLIRRL